MSTAWPERPALSIALVACEESGDQLGAGLMKALAARAPVRFSGVGGRHMAACGLQSLFPIDRLAIIGVTAVIARLPLLLRRIAETAEAVVAARPDALVIIDSPDFTHRVARRVCARAPEIPIIDYVSPSVWAWRPGRAKAMRGYVDHVLALLPFEPRVYETLGGPACSYVGHPAIEEAERLRPGKTEHARRERAPPVVLVLPGSRAGEVRRHLDVFGACLALLVERCGPLEAVLPTVPDVLAQIEAGTAGWPARPRIVVAREDKWAAFRSARAALAVSGTVTLELAIAGIPAVVAYKVSLVEEAIARLCLRTQTIVLANLVLGEKIMPELLQRAAVPERLASALAPL
ncbi:MAG TPA: lipid-A-disaccharide synthase, partial [Xanthobacteraceae bacterium]